MVVGGKGQISIHAHVGDQKMQAGGGQDRISTHAPVRERPSEALTNIAMGTHFNPLIPQGMSPVNSAPPRVGPRFQPTLPMRGATTAVQVFSPPKTYFNPHSRTESDQVRYTMQRSHPHFNPRPRVGATICSMTPGFIISTFQPPHPHAGVRPFFTFLLFVLLVFDIFRKTLYNNKRAIPKNRITVSEETWIPALSLTASGE